MVEEYFVEEYFVEVSGVVPVVQSMRIWNWVNEEIRKELRQIQHD
jgi:uncharacterized protein YacL (UPF0231 family)